ncbi:DUF2268 domain-containing putative Zn-dependent protease [Sporosarcina sp. 179-K 8C2 HS]|uniref:DUF2268 domain-containing putative Zn-dependent protease n=1 Tax=Sporosarcina sp. 179-K 8C2 HS TaxID=3142387 RepID=UPI0039A071FF
MVHVKQITPAKLLLNRNSLEEYLKEEFSELVSENTWITEWEQLVQRFQLFKFKELSETEIKSIEWNSDEIERIVHKTFQNVSQYLPFKEMRITVVPALLLPYFQEQPQSLWTNAFTNGPGNVIIAIPPRPDIDFLQYLLAHECHHASSENPIYHLSLSTFTLEQWYKMEGTAEYFALSLYPDKRWWKDNLPTELETRYWKECKDHLKSTDDTLKGSLCFGSRKKGIPVFAGYSFALKVVSNYVSTNHLKDVRELFSVEPSVLLECYANKHSIS